MRKGRGMIERCGNCTNWRKEPHPADKDILGAGVCIIDGGLARNESDGRGCSSFEETERLTEVRERLGRTLGAIEELDREKASASIERAFIKGSTKSDG